MASVSQGMSEGRDEKSGRYTSKYSREEFIEALSEFDGFAGTSEVAEHVGVPKRTAYDYLAQLRDEGRVSTRTVGNGNVWVLADETEA